jgi:ParB family chromosome partitioning protein
MAGLSEVPVVIVDADELKSAEISLIENIQREDLNPYEEAQGYYSLMHEFDLTQEQVSERVGKSRSAIANTLRLLDLPDEVLEMLKTGDISAGHARALLALTDKEMIVDTAQKILIRSLSVRDTEALVKKLNRLAQEADEGEDDERQIIIDYVKDLENRARELTGRQVKIKTKGKNKVLQVEFADNEDLETLLVKLCGKNIIEGVL